ncbi:alpha/beta fold hydrolase [Pseudonocardia sp. CA-107938]|uniref:alpha/beta fold hydrolase n=1 Tax=Pseudonocardia sp. CA-107938 TaxID=3240021 RepID=UPI003D8DA9DF
MRVDHLTTDDGLRLRWLEWGPEDGPVLVMLHGLRSYAATYEPLAQRLKGTWRCVAPDARGRGGSDWDPHGNYHTDRYVPDLSLLVEQLGAERVTLLGHSMGGATAMLWAAAHPDRVDALVVEDMLPGSSLRGAGADRIRRELSGIPTAFADDAAAFAYWRTLRPAAPDAAIADRVRHTTRPTPDGGREWIADMAGIGAARIDPARPPVDLWPAVPALPQRTLFICGGDSDFSDLDTLAEVRRRHPSARTVTIPGAGHYVHDDRPKEFAALVEAFLAEVVVLR